VLGCNSLPELDKCECLFLVFPSITNVSLWLHDTIWVLLQDLSDMFFGVETDSWKHIRDHS
jgi:hypothetical protein